MVGFSEISNLLPPEKVLEQFVIELTLPINVINDLAITLQNPTDQDEYQKILSQFDFITKLIDEHIRLILRYLDGLESFQNAEFWEKPTEINLQGSATLVLFTFLYELRSPLAGIKAYVRHFAKR